MPQPNDTICAIATATGGAIGIIRISGDDTFNILSKVFSKPIEDARPYTLHHGTISIPPSSISPSIPPSSYVATKSQPNPPIPIDDVLVSIFRSPHSYTGEDAAEISFHGSPYIAQQILSLLTQQGCRQANPGEFTQRAYLNGKLDLSQAEAVADLIASTNRATHQIAMNQLRGGISSELSVLRDQLLQLTSLLELELDFSDHEDLEFADRTELLELAQKIDTHITHLASTFHTGNALKNGIPVAIIGAPNVGKSTLLNALLGEERAIVSDIQGTTRDTIEDTLRIDGITFRFIDTAGIRHTTDRIESLGIGRTLTAAQRATIILMVTEPGIPYPNVPIRSDQTIIRIENKTETFQAKYGIGLNKLRTQILAAAPHTTDTDIIITNARHYDALLRAHQSLLHVLQGLHHQLPGDLLSEDLRLTLSHLADITGGQITPQETLNNIFSHFCIGK